MSYNPYQAGAEAMAAHQYTDYAKKKCLFPGVLLIVSGVLAMIGNVGGGLAFAGIYLGNPDIVIEEMKKEPQQELTEEELKTVMEVLGYSGLVVAALGFFGGLAIVAGGVQMIRLRGWIIAVLGAVLSMIPCFQGCFIFGIPIGIWCLVVLLDSSVKRSFGS